MTTPAGTDSCNTPCPFCQPAPERIVFENPLVIALWDAFPVNRGHALIIPRRHVPTWFDASAEERVALMAAVDEAAGQTVFHLHVHLIPRFDGDVPDPRGGVRWVIPAKGNYLLPPSTSPERTVTPDASSAGSPSPDRSRLISGGADDPLLHCLSEEFTRADQVDIAVGFVMQSGVHRIETHLRDFLGRGGRLRLLTGDYLGVTDPDALVRLLDLEGDRQLRVFETASSNRAAGTTPNATPNPAHARSPNANASPSAAPIAFHPKAYVFMRAGGDGVAFAGITQVFESLFHHPSTRELTATWVDGYRQRRKIAPRPETAPPTPRSSSPRSRRSGAPPTSSASGATPSTTSSSMSSTTRPPDLPPAHRLVPPQIPPRPHRHPGAHRRRRPALPLRLLRRPRRGGLPQHPLAQRAPSTSSTKGSTSPRWTPSSCCAPPSRASSGCSSPPTLFGLPPGEQVILDLLARARGGRIEIAPGCFVTYELETIDILGGLLRPPTTDALRRYYEDFVELHGLRPRAIEAFHDGYTPRAMRPRHGSWLGFIASMRANTASPARSGSRNSARPSRI